MPASTPYPLAQADRCVMCGLCLPHCPTYRISLNEGESPRGRIALMSAAARGQLPADSDHLRDHLDHCLGCRACERICPSGVPYGELIDAAQAQLQAGRPASTRGLQRLALDGILKHPRRVRAAAAVLRLAQRSGLARLANVIPAPAIRRAASQLPELPPSHSWQPYYPPSGNPRGEVALFTGCLGSVADIASNQAAITLLNRFGYGVHVPAGQRCFGALHQHSGDSNGAAALTRRNQQAFAAFKVEAILATASACTLTLREANPTRQTDIDEVSAFLARQPWPAGLTLRSLQQSVALHHPCSQVHGLRSHAHTAELLQRIPGIQLQPLPTQARCCGAAGSYMLRQPALSDQLGNEVLDQALPADPASPARTPAPTLLVSANIGCVIHLQALARQRGEPLEILHPLTLLQRQLPPPP